MYVARVPCRSSNVLPMNIYIRINCVAYVNIYMFQLRCLCIYTYVLKCVAYVYICMYVARVSCSTSNALPIYIYTCINCVAYGVATISRLLKMIGLFCQRAL